MTMLAHFRSHPYKSGLKLGFKTKTFITSGHCRASEDPFRLVLRRV